MTVDQSAQWLNRGWNGSTAWREVKRRWLACGALGALLLAVVAPPRPRGGAPYLDWTSYCARAYIYYSAGRESSVDLTRGAAIATFLARGVAPAIAVMLAALEWTDGRVSKGLVLTSLDGGCAWLSLVVSRDSATLSRVVATVACDYVATVVTAPLATTLLCGGWAVGLGGAFLLGCLGGLVPWAAGALLRRRRGALQGSGARRGAALVLLGLQCHGVMEAAQGTLHPAELAAVGALVLAWLGLVAACCCVSPHRAAELLQCVLPRDLARQDWVWSSACAPHGLGTLPAALLAPLQALLLSLLLPDTDEDELPH